MKRFLRALLAILCILLLALGGTALFLRSDGGKAWLARTVSSHVAGVTVSGLQGAFPDDLHIAHITVADAQGVWLEVTDAHLAWHPLALLHGVWRIDTLEAAAVQVKRKPLGKQETASTTFSVPTLPDIYIRALTVKEILLEQSVTGHRQRLTISGGGDEAGFDLQARTLEGADTSLTLHTVWKGGLKGDIHFAEAPSGIVGALLTLPENQALKLAMQADEAEGVIHVRDMEADIGSAHIDAEGSYAPAGKTIAADFRLGVPDISLFSGLAGTALDGDIRVTGKISGTFDVPLVLVKADSDSLAIGENRFHRSVITAQAQPHDGGVAFHALAETVRENMPISLEIEGMKKGKTIAFPAFRGNYGEYHAKGRGQVDLDARQFSVSLASEPFSHLLAGEKALFTATGEAKGGFDAFILKTTAHADAPQGKAVLTAEGKIVVGAKTFTGSLSGNFLRDGQRFDVQTPVDITPEIINFSDLAVKGKGLSLIGHAAWLTAKKQADASMVLNASDLAPLGRLLNVVLGGKATAKLILLPRERPEGTLDVSADGVTVGNTVIERLRLRAAGNQSALSTHADIAGNIAKKPFSLLLDSSGTRNDKTTAIGLRALSGRFDATPFALVSPVTVTLVEGSVNVPPTVLKLADGTLQLSAHTTSDTVSAELKAAHLALEKLPLAALPPGSINATLTVSGNPREPKASLNASGSARPADLPVKYSLDGLWQSGRLTFAGKAAVERAVLTFRTSLQGGFSLAPFAVGISADTPLAGKLALNAPLDMFNPYMRRGGIKLAGLIAGDMTLSGTVGTPVPNGKFQLARGTMDHQESGLCLRSLSAVLLADRERLTLETLRATSPTGSVQGKATLALKDEKPLEGTLSFSHMGLFCGGLAKGQLDGELKASGSVNAARLAGTLTLGPLNVQLPGQTPGQVPIPQVDVVKTGGARSKATGANVPMTLDIALAAPERIFVRGRGLDAEFGGNLAISGPVNAPDIRGTFRARRGRFTLLDRELQLTDANLRFNGPIPPSPYLDITAATTAENTTIQAHLTGPAKNPAFGFSSTPSLPKDQILALLLFGRTLSTLTPFQAIQLAQSVAELSGKTSGPGVLGTVRGALGLDRLDVGSDTKNNVTVGAGKYITDKVYVGVSQGAQPQDRAVTTEVEITPRVSATTSVDAEGQQSLGLEWKYDYE